MPRIGGNQININRVRHDLYPTDPRWTNKLLKRVSFRGPIWEPAAGNGSMVKVIAKRYKVRSTDIITGVNFLQQKTLWTGSIITNPPYSLLLPFVNKALTLATEQIALLMPISALGGKQRRDILWTCYPPNLVLIVSDRMSVLGKISQFNHVWVIWDKKKVTKPIIDWC